MEKHNASSDGDTAMSFKLVAAVFDMKVGNPLRKMVLIKLADQANDDGVCWPSYESIARSCEISRRSVVTHIQWLEDNGFLRIERRYNAAESKNFSNRYHLTLGSAKQFKKASKSKGGANSSLGKIDSDGANAALGGAGNALGSATDAPSNSAGAAPKPISKPINESTNESGTTKNKKAPKQKTERELLVMDLFKKWNELSGQSIRPLEKRLSHINARLEDGFTVEQIIEAMTFVATDDWHVKEGFNTIELVIRSTDQLEKKLLKAQSLVKKKAYDRANDKLAVNQHWAGANKSNIVAANTNIEDMF